MRSTSKAAKRFGILSVLLAAILVIAGCGGGAPEGEPSGGGETPQATAASSGEKPQIGFLMTLNHPYWQNMRLGAEDEAAQLGAEITIMNAVEDPVRQIEQINEVIAKQVDIVCLVPMKKDQLVRGVQMLNRADIPVIIVNREIGEGCEYVTYTGVETYQGALVSAKILAEAIGGKGQIVEFHQHLGSGPEIARSSALRDVLKDYPDIEIVARIPHNGEADVVKTEMQTLLQKYPELAGVYAHGDIFALAAAQTCHQMERPDIQVVGMGGSRDAIQAVREGVLAGTSYQQPEEEGRSAVRLAMRHLRGEELRERYPVECPAITKENADSFEGQF